MKKILSLIAITAIFGFISCSQDDCDHKSGPTPSSQDVVGSWYQEDDNEEIRFNENGTYYDKYCNILRSAETEGRWEYDQANKKLTMRSTFLGESRIFDWTVKNMTETGFTISSTTAEALKLEKIVETYNLEVGATATINYNAIANINSYTSKNARLASVTADGKITAEGEKGTTYIKLSTDNGNVWVKVVVGDECEDLWYDYVSVIGLGYSSMANALGKLGEPYNGDDGYSYGFINQMHTLIDITKIYLCQEEGIVTEIHLVMKEGVPESKLLTYMDSHYYKMIEIENYVYYSTKASVDESKAVIVYNKNEKTVIFIETAHFLQTAHVEGLWNDFNSLFGKDKNTVKTFMNQISYSYFTSNDQYSENGADYYETTGNNYTDMIAFVYNPDNLCSEYWVYLKNNVDKSEVLHNLVQRYREDTEASDNSDYSFIFYSYDQTQKIEYNIAYNAVIYTNLTMKQHVPNTEYFGRYYEGLGMTREQIKNKFGLPYMEENTALYYYIGSDYVNLVVFDFATDKCDFIIMTTQQTKETVIDYFTDRYTVYQTSEDESRYTWINGSNIAESTIGVTYVPGNNMIYYHDLSTGTAQSKRSVVEKLNAGDNLSDIISGCNVMKSRLQKSK